MRFRSCRLLDHTCVALGTILIAVSFSVRSSSAYPSKPIAHANALVLTNVTIIDMTGTPPKTGTTVIISGGRITEIRKTGKMRPPKGGQVIDCTGKFLIPGLWDMHVHTLSGGQPEQFFPLFIANGITGVRDMGGDIPLQQIAEIKRDIETGKRLGPEIFAAGPIVEGERKFWNFSVSVKNAETAKPAIDELVSSGVDFIKVYNSLSRAAYLAIASEAKSKHVSFVGHIPEEVTPLEASRVGHKSIEHLAGIKIEVARDPADLRRQRLAAQNAEDAAQSRDLFFKLNTAIIETYDPEKARNIFRQFAENGTWQSPTLVVLRAYATIHELKLRNDDRLAFMPQKLKDSWSRSGGKPDPQNAWMQMRLFDQNLLIVNEMRGAGVKFLAGTDTPNPYTFPGFSLHEELELLVKAGFSPMQALQTATRNPAKFLGQLKSRGTIEKGKIADLILLDANPLLNIRNTKQIDSVIRAGRMISKSELNSLLMDAKMRLNEQK